MSTKDQGSGYALVVLSGKPRMVLEQVTSASGTRYSDGDVVLATKGNRATLSAPSFELRDCRVTSSNSRPVPQLSGMFQIRADSPVFTLCDKGWQLPVALTGAYRDMYAAYRDRNSSKDALQVSVEARIELRPVVADPSVENRYVPTLVVSKFVTADPGRTCSSQAPSSGGTASPNGLIGAWQLRQLGGEQPPQLRKPMSLNFRDDGRVSGFAGCNQFNAGWQSAGSQLKIERAALTRMACIGEAAVWEEKFVRVLNSVNAYRIAGSNLELLAAGDALLAVFERAAE